MTRELIRFIVGQVFVHATMTGMRLAAPLLALREGYSPGAVGFLLSLFALTQVFLSLPAGRYTDRHGFKRPTLMAIAAAGVGALVAVAVPAFWGLCVAALLTGGATGVSIVALQRYAGRQAHEASELRVIFSWLSLGPAVANFMGPFVAGMVIDHATSEAGSTLAYRIAFGALAAMPLLSWLCVRGAKTEAPSPPQDDGQPHHAWDLLQQKNFRWLLIVNWMVSSCWDAHTFVVPLLGHEKGLSASQIGMVLGMFAIAAALIRLLLPVLSRHCKEMTVVATAMMVTSLGFALYPFMGSVWTMVLCSVVLGAALGSVQPMAMSMLHQLTPEDRHGEAVGLRLMLINGSSVVMPLLFGSAGAAIGVGGVFWVMGALVGSGSRLAWMLGKMPMPDLHPPHEPARLPAPRQDGDGSR
ncbi:MAG: MFS transporter [Comamonas sp.]